MSGTLRVSICDPNQDTRENLKKYLIGMENVYLEADSSRYEFFNEIVEQTSPDVVLIDVDSDDQAAIRLIEQVHRNHAKVGIIAISARTDGQLILQVMRAGAREFLSSPIQIEELVGALDRVSNTVGDPEKKSKKSGSVISICGASGGVGTTSVAVNLACGLARHMDNSVVLIDIDLSLGDADVFLDMIPEYTLLDVAQNIARLDLSLLRKSLTKHETGVYLLPRPIQLDDIQAITPENFKKVLGLLKASFTHLVIDLSKSYNALDMAALEMSDHILLLTQLDLPCLRNVVRLLTSMEAYEGVSERIKIIVNRIGLDASQISAGKAEETIDREIFWRIPNNFSVISECRNNGVPLLQQAPKSAITQSINELADRLSGHDSPVDSDGKKEKKGWLTFLKK